MSSRILTLASTAIIVRLLGKEHYGEFGMVQSTLLLLGTFAGLGLGITATKHTAQFRTEDPQRLGRLLGLLLTTAVVGGLFISLAGWVGSSWLAERVLARAALQPYLQITAILVLLGAVDGVCTATLAGFEAFSQIARVSISVALLSPLLTVPLVYNWGLEGAVWGLVASLTMQLVQNGIALRRECRKHNVVISFDHRSGSEWPILMRFALPVLAANLLVMPATWIANVIMVNSGAGFAGLGVVNVVNTLKTLALYLPTVLLAPTFAVLSNVAAKPAALRNTLRYALGMSALTVLPLALVVTALGKFVLSALYGSDYAGEGMMLACAMIVAAIQATGAGLGHFLVATGRIRVGLAINLLFGVLFVGLAYFLIPPYGPIGYLSSMAIAYLITTGITYVGLSLTLPAIIRCYPLTQALAFFALLMVAAVYVNRHCDLPLALASAALLGVVMAGVLALPILRWTQGGPRAESAYNETSNLTEGES